MYFATLLLERFSKSVVYSFYSVSRQVFLTEKQLRTKKGEPSKYHLHALLSCRTKLLDEVKCVKKRLRKEIKFKNYDKHCL